MPEDKQLVNFADEAEGTRGGEGGREGDGYRWADNGTEEDE